jgi:Protein of unknown function (DUF4232)
VLRALLLATVLLASAAPARAATPRCHTADLAGHLGFIQGAAGSRFGPLVLVNRSGHTCTVRGYIGGQLNGVTGKLSTRVVRDRSLPVTTVRLAAGHAAVTVIRWSAIPAGSASTCPLPRSFSVTPPDEVATLRVAWHGGQVCGGGEIDVRPLRAQL